MWRQVMLIAPLFVLACEHSSGRYVLNAQVKGPEACVPRPAPKDWASYGPEGKAFELEKGKLRSLLLGGHCISNGKGTVLRYASWRSSIPFISDTENYMQLTISVPDLPRNVQESKQYSVRGGDMYFTESGPWIGQGYGWYSLGGSGELRLTRIDSNKIHVNGNFDIELQHANDGIKKNQRVSIDDSLVEATYNDLASCLGQSPTCPSK